MAEAKTEFQLAGSEYIELKNLLKVAGFVEHGGAAKAAITENQVKVDGVVETRKACKIRPGQVVSYQGKSIKVTA